MVTTHGTAFVRIASLRRRTGNFFHETCGKRGEPVYKTRFILLLEEDMSVRCVQSAGANGGVAGRLAAVLSIGSPDTGEGAGKRKRTDNELISVEEYETKKKELLGRM